MKFSQRVRSLTTCSHGPVTTRSRVTETTGAQLHDRVILRYSPSYARKGHFYSLSAILICKLLTRNRTISSRLTVFIVTLPCEKTRQLTRTDPRDAVMPSRPSRCTQGRTLNAIDQQATVIHRLLTATGHVYRQKCCQQQTDDCHLFVALGDGGRVVAEFS